jgi:hypothetical protein
VVFNVASEPSRRDRLLKRVAEATGVSDRVILSNEDELAGTIETIGAESLQLRADVGPFEVETARLDALVFNPTLRRRTQPEGLRAWVGLADGSLLLASQMVLEPGALQITLAEDLTWTTEPRELVWLQPLGGRAVYLSDLAAAGFRHIPFLELPWEYQDDANVAGGALRCAGRRYLKGLGVHSTALLTYALTEADRRFEAELGIDDATGGGGSVRFRVFVDGRPEPEYSSEIIRGGEPPVPISVDTTGAERLDLVVDFADRADQADYADWLNARLIR